MSMLDRKLLRDLVHLRGQMIAVALVVACGIAVYVSMGSVLDSLRATRDAYYDEYHFADVFAGVKRAPERLGAEIARLDGVDRVETRVVVEVTLDVPGLGEPATGRLVSVPDREMPPLNRLYLRRGRYIEPGRNDQVIVGEAFADANHLEPGATIGAVINGRWKRLTVVGVALSPEYVYTLGGAATFVPDNRRFGVLWMGREGMAAAYDMDGAFNDLVLTVVRGAKVPDLIDRLDLMLKPYGSLGAYDRSDQMSDHFLRDELAQLRASAVLIPLIFLGVAIFLMNIVLTRLVATQRDQIAVLKAFGYDNAAIGLHFMKFALAAVLVGALLGTGVGIWLGKGLTHLYTRYYRFPLLRYVAGPEVIAWAVIISAVSGMLGAWRAVRRGASLPPAEAMRPEAPARFEPGFLERLPLGDILSTSGRMILRSLERNRTKAALTVLAIALSEGVLICGYFSYDSISFMIDLQFRAIQREDVMLLFNRPLPARALFDLRHLPGVTRTEPFRMVPARIRFAHHQRRLAIQGIDAGDDLRRILDRNRHRALPPPEGVLLTTKLAEELGAGIGDSLTIEVLEGAQPVASVPITGTVDELLGVSVYMDRAALNRLMREGPTISGAFVAIDARHAEELNRALKVTPAVAGASFRSAGLESFDTMMSESQGTSRTILVIFAGVITFGIVYNSARISLSERGRELASLRVLGFSRREVAFMLLGEQTVLTVLAIPVGFAIGYLTSAGVILAMNGENYRIPLVITSATYGLAALAVIASAALSALMVRRRIYTLDIIEVLKTRE